MGRIVRLTEKDLTQIVKRVISEQTEEDKRNEYIAKLIYNAKGYFMDENDDVVKALKLIKDSTQWWKVNKKLKDLTGDVGIAKYIDSFMHGNELDMATSDIGSVWSECERIWGHREKSKYPFSEMDNARKWYQQFRVGGHSGVN